MRKNLYNLLVLFIELICIFLLFPPDGIGRYIGEDSFSSLKIYGTYICFVFGLFLFLINKSKYVHTVYLIGALKIWLLITTIINNGIASNALYYTCRSISAVIIFSYFISNYRKQILDIFYVYYIFIATISIVMFFLFPDGMYKHLHVSNDYIMYYRTAIFFLGTKNNYSFLCIPFYLMSIIRNIEKGRKSIFVTLITAINIILCKSSTGILALIIMFIAYKCYNSKFNKNMSGILILTNISTFFGLVIFKVQIYLEFFIKTLFGKDSSFSNRTEMWQKALTLISKKIMYGYGSEQAGAVINYHGFLYYAHNQWLDLLIEGGIIALVIFMILLLVIFHIVKDNKYSRLIFSYLCALTVIMTSESLLNNTLLFVSFILIEQNNNAIYKNGQNKQ